MNPCEHIASFIGPYLYGDLETSEFDVVQSHLRSCQSCRQDVAERRTALASLAPRNPTADERERILRAVRSAGEGAHLTRAVTARSARRVLAIAGALCLGASLFLAGVWVGWRASPASQTTSEVASARSKPGKSIPTATSLKERELREPEGASPDARLEVTRAVAVPRRELHRPVASPPMPGRHIPHPAALQTATVLAPVPCGVDDVSLAKIGE